MSATGLRVVAIVAAGGRGTRFGAAVPKQMMNIDRRSILEHSVDAFATHPLVAATIIVVSPELMGPAQQIADGRRAVRVTEGGERRQDSVARGFALVGEDDDVVLVHDAARPLVSPDVISRVIDAAAATGAAIAAERASDTVKRSTSSDQGACAIAETIPRQEIWLAQTPQGFRREILAEAIALGASGIEATDEASLAEQAGHRVVLVDSPADNLKITTDIDLTIARALLAGRDHTASSTPSTASVDGMTDDASGRLAPIPRLGMGYDLHLLVEGRPLLLGGVKIPFERGLLGFSDADVLAHAVTDAILGAASLGDIGRLFPDTDPRWEGADSMVLLADAVARVRAAGYVVGNVDAVVIAERPRIGPHVDAIRESLARALGVDVAAVAVKGKTNEGVDATGRGEAIAVHAVALVLPR